MSYLKQIKLHRRIVLPAFLFSLTLLIPIHLLTAQVMQGTNYRIQSDSVNFGGGDSGSANYGLQGTGGEIGTGDSSSANYALRAGFQQMDGSFISISSPGNIALDPISGLAGGSSEKTAAWTVTTDDPAGYSLTVNTTTSPALKSADDSFADYAPSGADPDYTFSVSSANSAFGFTPEGTDVSTRYKDNGSACNTGSSETSGKCWDGFSTTPKAIANRASSNQPSGTSTTLRVRAESGSSHMQTAGNYSATLVVTATAL